ncbi:recombinase family protein [uncultured Oscillibacter sp.]|uniref:recombinase family protein n=1 Tax=uncultured Oscillibacter sp. TaxID=876091 RepID=UPI0028051CBE|nr:recombinase family protein [uncultured Oscillibacter sp.]
MFNDMYAKDISKKIKSVKRDKQRKGLFIGGKPMFGYKMHPTEKNKIVIDEEAAPIVRRIFAMAMEGVSCRQIAAQLNAEGVPTPAVYAGLNITRPGPYAGLWSSERVSDMLSNETYLGNMVQGRTRKISYKSKKCVKQKPQDWVVVEGTHEPLVSPEEFETVRMMVDSRRHTRSRTYDFLLKGLIYCHECGYPMAVINRKKPNGQDCLYFVCRTYQRFTKAGVCTCHSIKEESVTNAVVEQVQAICDAYIHREELTSVAEREVRESQRAQKLQQGIGDLTAKVKSLTAHLDQVYMDKLGGVLSENDFGRIYQKVKVERTALERKLEKLTAQAERPVDHAKLAEGLVERFLSAAGRSRELLVSLIERIEYSEDRNLYIHFKFPQLEGLLDGDGIPVEGSAVRKQNIQENDE